MANNMIQQVQLGGITLSGFEVPENLPNLFGVQKTAVHDFPGGTRTIQNLGAFTFSDIEWHGSLFLGDTGESLEQRSQEFNKYRMTGEIIQLTWGQFNFNVMVHEFEIIARMAQLYDYRIKLIPLNDLTGNSNQASGSPPSSPSQAQQVTNASAAVTTSLNSSTSGFKFSTGIQDQVNGITTDTNNAIINAGGVVSNVPQSTVTTLQGQISAVQSDMSGLVNSSDYAASTAASTLSNNLGALNDAITGGPLTPVSTIVITNPNLYVLAAQYYGDQTQWPLIAGANNLQDPIITNGQTYSLTIPPLSTPSQYVIDNAA